MARHSLDRAKDFDLDGGFLEAVGPGTDLVFLCTPNNPTGRLIDQELLLAAAEKCRDLGAVLAVDECFLPLSDGAGPGLAPYLETYPNLVLLRAFTKSWAMAGAAAGLRPVCRPRPAGEAGRRRAALERVRPRPGGGAGGPEAVPQLAGGGPDPAGRGAAPAFGRPGGAGAGGGPQPGQLPALPGGGGEDLKERALARGVLLRACGNYHGLGSDWYRVCVGGREQNRRLLPR